MILRVYCLAACALVASLLVHSLSSSATAGPTPLPASDGWSPYGNDYAVPAVERVGDTIYLSGLIAAGGSGSWAQPLTTLPAGLRPSRIRVMHANRHHADARVDIRPDGTVAFVTGGTVGWVSLSGLAYSLKAHEPLAYASGWSDYGGNFAAGGYTVEDGVVRLQGLVKGSTSGESVIATLPAAARPAARRIYRVNQHEVSARVDVLPNGEIRYVQGSSTRGWVSLEGIAFSNAPATAPSYGPGWVDASGGVYTPPSVETAGGHVRLRGFTRLSSGTGMHVLTLPAGARPDKQLIFGPSTHTRGARVDVHPDGKVIVQNLNTSKTTTQWLSLDGIQFSTSAIGVAASTLPDLAPAPEAPAPPTASDDEATAAARSLPGFSLLGSSLTAVKEGEAYRLSVAGGISAFAFKGNGWHAAVALRDPDAFTVPGLDQLGSLDLGGVVLIASATDDELPRSWLPASLADPLAAFGTTVRLKRGINLLVSGVAGTAGALGKLRSAIGMGNQPVLMQALVGAGVFTQALASANNPSGVTSPDNALSAELTLPAIVPPPFNAMSAAERSVLDLEIQRTTLTLQRTGTTWAVGGEMRSRVVFAERVADVTSTLTFSGSGTDRSVAFAGKANLVNPFAPFGVDSVQVRGLGVEASLSTGTGTKALAVTADLRVGTADLSARFGTIVQGSSLVEVSAGLTGSLSLPSSLMPGGVGALTLSNPVVGLRTATGEGFVSGTVSWRGMSATALVFARKSPAGLAVFLSTRNGTLSGIVGSAVPFDISVPKTVLVASSIAMPDVPLSALPSPAQEMLTEIGVSTSGKVSATTGLTLLTSINPKATFPALGIDRDILLAGSIGVEGGKPTFGLYADLATFTMPPEIQRYGFTSATPRFFLQLTSAPQLSIGVAMGLGLKLDGQPLQLDGRLYGVLGTSGAGLQVAGTLKSDWRDPFGLTGITIGKNTGLQFGVSADGSARVVMNGAATFDGLSFGLGGGASVLFSSGIPTLKGLAMRFSASELGLLVPAKVGQTTLRAMANVASNLVGKTGTALPSSLTSALNTAKTADIVGLVESVLPTSGLAAQLAAMTLKDVELFLATPGMDAGPDFPDLDDVGVKVKGKLFKGAQQLAAVDTFLTTKKGFQLKASTVDFAIGPISVSNPSVDLGAGIPGLHSVAPRFRITGAVSLNGFSFAALDIDLSPSEVRLGGSLSLAPGSVSLSGKLTSASAWSMTGDGALNLPNVGFIDLPSATASFTMASGLGLKFTMSANVFNATFAASGGFTSRTSWSLTAVATARHGSTDVSLGYDVPDPTLTDPLRTKRVTSKVGTLTVYSGGKLHLTMSPSAATVTFKGAGKFTTVAFTGLPAVTTNLSFDETIGSDLSISRTFKVPRPLPPGMVDKTVSFRVFP